MSDRPKHYHLADGPLAGGLISGREGPPPAKLHIAVGYYIPIAEKLLPKHKPPEELPIVHATLVYRFERTRGYHDYLFEELVDS